MNCVTSVCHKCICKAQCLNKNQMPSEVSIITWVTESHNHLAWKRPSRPWSPTSTQHHHHHTQAVSPRYHPSAGRKFLPLGKNSCVLAGRTSLKSTNFFVFFLKPNNFGALGSWHSWKDHCYTARKSMALSHDSKATKLQKDLLDNPNSPRQTWYLLLELQELLHLFLLRVVRAVAIRGAVTAAVPGLSSLKASLMEGRTAKGEEAGIARSSGSSGILAKHISNTSCPEVPLRIAGSYIPSSHQADWEHLFCIFRDTSHSI